MRGVYTLQVDFASQQLERYLEGREAGPQFHNKTSSLLCNPMLSDGLNSFPQQPLMDFPREAEL